MVPLIATEVFRAVVDGMILAILFGAIGSCIWTTSRLLRGYPIFPQVPLVEREKPPWSVGTILLILAMYILVSREAFETYARATGANSAGGRVDSPVRVDQKAVGESGPRPAAAKPEVGPPPHPDRSTPRDRRDQPPGPSEDHATDATPYGLSALELMCIQGAINGLFLLLMPGLAWLTARARPRDLGLTALGWRRQVAVGIVAVLSLMPIVYSIQVACVSFLGLPDSEREKFKHPLEKMLGDHFSPGVASLAFLTAVVLAPAFEELLFRGFLQSWLVNVFTRLVQTLHSSHLPRIFKSTGDPAIPKIELPYSNPLFDPDHDRASTIAISGSEYWETAEDGESVPAGEDFDGAAPATRDHRSRRRSRLGTAAAIGLTSLVFAALHAPQWPAPIPLFALALGLGIVYQRTGSLLAPICMHAVFNGFSTLMLFHVALQGPDPQKPSHRPVLERVVPSEKTPQPLPTIGPRLPGGKT